MPPNTQFDKEICISGGRVTVKGTLEDPETDVRRAIVFAFVTQSPLDQPGANAATVAGEALLYPVKKPMSDDGPKWWLVDPLLDSTIEPKDSLRRRGKHEHSYDFNYKTSANWYFDTNMKDKTPLRVGPAFGTAILVTFMVDGSIETYSWSGWVNVVDDCSSPAASA